MANIQPENLQDVQKNAFLAKSSSSQWVNHNELGGMGLKGLWLLHGLVFGSFVDSCFQLVDSFVKGEGIAGELWLEEMRVGRLAQFLITRSYTGFILPVDCEILGVFKGINKKNPAP